MAEETPVSTPTPDPNAAAAPAAAPPSAPMTPAPAAAVAPDPNAAQAQAQTHVDAANQAFKKAQDLAKPDAPAAPVPHAKLLAMIQGLSLGLSAAATSIGTHGQEGGAKEVIQVQAEQQRQKLEAQRAAQEQKNQQIQNQIMVGDTNMKMAQMVPLLATMHDDITKAHLAVTGEETRQKGEQQAQAITGADFQAAHGGMNPTEFSSAMASTTPISASQTDGKPGPSTFFTTNAQQQLGAASEILGPNDPYVKKLHATLADPNATPKDLYLATQQVQQQQSLHKEATTEELKRQEVENAKRPKDLNDATGRFAKAQTEYKTNPTPDTKKALDDAKANQSTFFEMDRKQKQIAQDIQNGDPEVIGAAMANGLYAPSQVLSARSMTKKVYSQVLDAANRTAKANGAPEIIAPNGRHTGEYFNAAVSEGQFKYSQNVQTQNVLNKVLTLNEAGGDLDILKDASSELPKLNEQTINKIFNGVGKEFGSRAATNYHMALYNTASLLAQVQTGGIPTEGEIQQQLDLMHQSFSEGQLDGALQIVRKDIGARSTSMVANNPYLRYQYPTLANPQQSTAPVSTGKAVSLAEARNLPAYKGKSDDVIKADIVKAGHQVVD